MDQPKSWGLMEWVRRTGTGTGVLSGKETVTAFGRPTDIHMFVNLESVVCAEIRNFCLQQAKGKKGYGCLHLCLVCLECVCWEQCLSVTVTCCVSVTYVCLYVCLSGAGGGEGLHAQCQYRSIFISSEGKQQPCHSSWAKIPRSSSTRMGSSSQEGGSRP